MRLICKKYGKTFFGYEGLYQVSNLGRIKSLPRNGTILKERILKENLSNKGYYMVVLSKNNIPKKKLIHRIVAQTFIPNPYNKGTVNHIDGNKLNNKVENLEWCTIKENNIHARKNGLTNDYGSNNKLSKFSNEEIKFIRENYIKNDKEYGCRALAKKFNVSKSTISYIINNITYFK